MSRLSFNDTFLNTKGTSTLKSIVGIYYSDQLVWGIFSDDLNSSTWLFFVLKVHPLVVKLKYQKRWLQWMGTKHQLKERSQNCFWEWDARSLSWHNNFRQNKRLNCDFIWTNTRGTGEDYHHQIYVETITATLHTELPHC